MKVTQEKQEAWTQIASWKAVYKFVVECGREHSPSKFCGKIVELLPDFVPYDQARVLFLSVSGKIYNSLLYGVGRQSWDMFMEYYMDGSAGSIYKLNRPVHPRVQDLVSVCDWTDPKRQEKYSDFADNYVKKLRLKYCLGFGMRDKEGCLRVIITLDRIQYGSFSKEEVELVRVLQTGLENLYINLLTDVPRQFTALPLIGPKYQLTMRESHIAELLCQGATPSTISDMCSISKATVYKHIANIYKKMGISNRQELFSKFCTDINARKS